MKNKNMLFEIVKKELRDVLRDTKTMIMMIILPLVIYPLIIATLIIIQDAMMTTDESNYNKIGFAFEIDSAMNTVIDELEIQKVEDEEDILHKELENDEIDAYITLNDKQFTIYYKGQNEYGYATIELASQLLEGYKKALQSQMLTSEGLLPDEIFNIYTIEQTDISNSDALSEYLIKMVPTFIIMATVLTAAITATDMTAGEKERGTLETLLTFPLKSKDIIGGKFIATTICTLISSIFGFYASYSIVYILFDTLESFKSLQLLSITEFIFVLIIFILFAMLMSAIAIVVSSRAKSFKEAQNATQPLAFITIIPMFMAMMGIKLNSMLSLIPIVNVNLLLSEIISGDINLKYFLITIIANIVFILILIKIAAKLYKSDKILFS